MASYEYERNEGSHQYVCTDCGKMLIGMDRCQIVVNDTVIPLCIDCYMEHSGQRGTSFEYPPEVTVSPGTITIAPASNEPFFSWADIPQPPNTLPSFRTIGEPVEEPDNEAYRQLRAEQEKARNLRNVIGDPSNLRWIASHLSAIIPDALRQGYQNYLNNIADAAEHHDSSSPHNDS